MISIKKLRNNKDSFKSKLALKNDNTDLDLILSLDAKLRELKTVSSEMRAERNSASDAIGKAKKAGDDASAAISTMRDLGENIKEIESDLQDVSTQLDDLLFKIPNPPHDSSPEGKDESDNVEVRSWGSKPEFDFTPKTHTEIGESLELFDFNYVKVIREYMGLSNNRSEETGLTSTNQAIYKEIRGCMDNAAKRYRNKKEWEERQEQIMEELKTREENRLLTIKEED